MKRDLLEKRRFLQKNMRFRTVVIHIVLIILLHARNEFCGSADTSADVSNHDHFMIA